MDTLFAPEQVFEISLDQTSANTGHSVALVVPSTHATLRLARDLWAHWIVVGSRTGTKPISSALSAVGELFERRPTMIFTDQLYRPADANVLALLGDMQLYLSPLEYILCSKYGYRLGVWTAGGMQWLEPGAEIKDVAALMVTHLRDCAKLEKDWVEMDKQAMRLHSNRERSVKRQLCFLHSSTANTYMDDPAHPTAGQLLARIGTLGKSIARETAA